MQSQTGMQGQNLARRDQIFTLVLFGIVVLGVLGYCWRHRQEIETEVKLLANEIKLWAEWYARIWTETRYEPSAEYGEAEEGYWETEKESWEAKASSAL